MSSSKLSAAVTAVCLCVGKLVWYISGILEVVCVCVCYCSVFVCLYSTNEVDTFMELWLKCNWFANVGRAGSESPNKPKQEQLNHITHSF